jgi:hypothetical protein
MQPEISKMQIDETINNWFQETENKLQALGLPKNNIDNMIFASIPLIDNFFNNVLMILNNGLRLPTMALLRVLNQIASRIVWVLMGRNKNENELQNRFDRWALSSYKSEHEFLKKIVGFYAGKDKTKFENTIKIYEQEIDKLKKAAVKELPQPEQILEEVFRKKQIAIGVYRRFHNSIHPDLMVLGKTFKNTGTTCMYKGDIDEKIDDLKSECLICAHRFFKEICRYYKLNLLGQRIENEFKTRMPKS